MPTRSLVDVQEYHACVEEYRAELQAAMHKSPGLLDQMRARSVCYEAWWSRLGCEIWLVVVP